jgi:hypothetical protein
MKQFTFFWLDGRRTTCEGKTPADALVQVGYGAGAIRALDFYAIGDNNDYNWNPDTRNWDPMISMAGYNP